MKLVFETSTKTDGNMAFNWGEKKVVLNNRTKWLNKFDLTPDDCVYVWLALGTDYVSVSKKNVGKLIEKVDALITDDVDVPLMMVVGDCFPVVLFDPISPRLALIHLGYQGIVGGLLPKVVNRFKELGSKVEDLQMVVGPGVKKESYVFPEDDVVQRGLSGWGKFLTLGEKGVQVDLYGYLLNQAQGLGIQKIEGNEIDTIADLNYFSHYRSKRITGEPEGRIAALAMMKS